jgi:transcriptional regulator with XRE-family HTH domain
MLKTSAEWLIELGQAIRARRIARGWSQREAAERSGLSHRTWRRLEVEGEGSVRHLVQAAFALGCETQLALLFPAPVAGSLDELLKHQAAESAPAPRRRAARRRPLG